MALLILNHTYPIVGLMIFHMVIKLKLAKFKVMHCFIPRQITCRHPDPMIVHCAQITTYSLLLNLLAITTCYKILQLHLLGPTTTALIKGQVLIKHLCLKVCESEQKFHSRLVLEFGLQLPLTKLKQPMEQCSFINLILLWTVRFAYQLKVYFQQRYLPFIIFDCNSLFDL